GTPPLCMMKCRSSMNVARSGEPAEQRHPTE
nr:hypothetical protein [Tanacetum cinerariifolium]